MMNLCGRRCLGDLWKERKAVNFRGGAFAGNLQNKKAAAGSPIAADK